MYYKIDLPVNTVEWYYILTTSAGETESKATLNLVPQLTRLFDPTGMSALAASAIMVSTGSNTCAVFLMDRQNADAFYRRLITLGVNITILSPDQGEISEKERCKLKMPFMELII